MWYCTVYSSKIFNLQLQSIVEDILIVIFHPCNNCMVLFQSFYLLFYCWFYFPVFSLYPLLFLWILYNTFPYPFVYSFPQEDQYSFMISYLKILSHIPQSQDCSQWCYREALSGAAPLKLNGVSGCQLLNGLLQFLHRNKFKTIALPLL